MGCGTSAPQQAAPVPSAAPDRVSAVAKAQNPIQTQTPATQAPHKQSATAGAQHASAASARPQVPDNAVTKTSSTQAQPVQAQGIHTGQTAQHHTAPSDVAAVQRAAPQPPHSTWLSQATEPQRDASGTRQGSEGSRTAFVAGSSGAHISQMPSTHHVSIAAAQSTAQHQYITSQHISQPFTIPDPVLAEPAHGRTSRTSRQQAASVSQQVSHTAGAAHTPELPPRAEPSSVSTHGACHDDDDFHLPLEVPHSHRASPTSTHVPARRTSSHTSSAWQTCDSDIGAQHSVASSGYEEDLHDAMARLQAEASGTTVGA